MDDFPLISHGCWDEDSGGHSEFLRWRALLARAAGIGTEMVELGELRRELPRLDYDSLTLENTRGIWNLLPDDQLVILLAHSDEEGVILYSHAKLLAKRLEGLLPSFSFASHHKPGSVLQQAERARTIQFIEGLRRAVYAEEDITFE